MTTPVTTADVLTNLQILTALHAKVAEPARHLSLVPALEVCDE